MDRDAACNVDMLNKSSFLENSQKLSIFYSKDFTSFTDMGSICSPFATAVSMSHQRTEIDWQSFRGWLAKRGFTSKYQSEMLRCAKKHAGSLFHGKLGMLDRNGMASLANLSKFLGMYKRFKAMREENGLKWTATVNAENAFLRLYSGEEDVKYVESWMDEAKGKARYDIWIPTVFCAVSGLRTNEAVKSLNLIAEGEMERGYLSKDGILEHFRYGKLFLRRTKKAFITIVPNAMLEELQNWRGIKTSYPKLRSWYKRKTGKCNLYSARSWFNTILRVGGIDSEICDLLCGRMPNSVFLRSYYRPDIREVFDKVKRILKPYAERWLD